MSFTGKGVVPTILVLAAAAASFSLAAGQRLAAQADVQIRTLEITRSRAGHSVRVVVYTEHDNEARDVRLLVLLPAGVELQRSVAGCASFAGSPRVLSSRATVTCELGSIADRAFHEVVLMISSTPRDSATRVGVFAYSGTPDPRPGNNYAERILP